MKLTSELKQKIDSKSYVALLAGWRHAPCGSAMFEGESGKYYAERMAYLRSQPGGNAEHVSASKSIGW